MRSVFSTVMVLLLLTSRPGLLAAEAVKLAIVDMPGSPIAAGAQWLLNELQSQADINLRIL